MLYYMENDMDHMINSLKTVLAQFNESLHERRAQVERVDHDTMRLMLEKRLGPIVTLPPSSPETVAQWAPLIGVDGSNITLGGNDPHNVTLFSALAKSTDPAQEPLTEIRLQSPLLGECDATARVLSTLEVEVARKAVLEYHPPVLMMDGGLLRYIIDAEEAFVALRNTCLDTDTLLVGVIKDIKSQMVSEVCPELCNWYDREALFGVLERGELLEVRQAKKHEDLASGFLRPAYHPAAIGLDTLVEQREHLSELAQLVMALTPAKSRGVPMWLDLVDREVRLSRRESEALLRANLDPAIYRLFMASEREERPL